MQLADAAYQERDRLVINHLGLVKKVAVGLVRRLPAQVEMNELIGEGVVGLLDAARRYKPASGVPFEAFAARRVRGSMLDALRAVDTASRRTRRMERNLKATCTGLRQTLGRDPLDNEVADAMGSPRPRTPAPAAPSSAPRTAASSRSRKPSATTSARWPAPSATSRTAPTWSSSAPSSACSWAPR